MPEKKFSDENVLCCLLDSILYVSKRIVDENKENEITKKNQIEASENNNNDFIKFLKEKWKMIFILMSIPCIFIILSMIFSTPSKYEILTNTTHGNFSGESSFHGINISNSIPILTSVITFIGLIYSSYTNNLRLEKDIKANREITEIKINNSIDNINSLLNFRLEKTSLTTLKSIINDLIYLESKIKSYPKDKSKDHELSKWVIENLFKNKRIYNYYKNLKQELNNSLNYDELKNKEKDDIDYIKDAMREICEKTGKFYDESYLFELPDGIFENLDNLKNNNINKDSLKEFNDEINQVLNNYKGIK